MSTKKKSYKKDLRLTLYEDNMLYDGIMKAMSCKFFDTKEFQDTRDQHKKSFHIDAQESCELLIRLKHRMKLLRNDL